MAALASDLGNRAGALSGLRVTYRSAGLWIATGSSDRIRSAADRLCGQEFPLRYYLSAGSGPFQRQPWWHAHPLPKTEDPVRVDWYLIERILNVHEHQRAATERAAATGPGDEQGPPGVVMEIVGEPNRDDAAFLQACRLRLAGRPDSATVVLRHAPDAEGTGDRLDGPAREILLCLLLAGGSAAEAELGTWARRRGWDASAVTANTSPRAGGPGTLYTYASSSHRLRAGSAFAEADPVVRAELAALVAAGQTGPIVATARVVGVPSPALTAIATLAGGRRDVLEDVLQTGQALFRESRKGGWTALSKGAAGGLLLAALVALGRAASPGSVGALLNLADRFGVDPEIRSGLAYAAGQGLARDSRASSRAASIRCFEYVQRCVRDHPSTEPERDRSRIAAAHNGAALAMFKAGDRLGAVTAELAGLEALTAAGASGDHLRDQQVLLLTNTAKVHWLVPGSRPQALDCYRRAWRVACEADSVAGMAYVAADLVPRLIGRGEVAEARIVAERLLRRHDETGTVSRNAERAVVAICCALAESGPAEESAFWYAEGVRRMRRAAPRMVEAVMANVRRHPDVPATVAEELGRELTRHRAMAGDLAALRELAAGGGERD